MAFDCGRYAATPFFWVVAAAVFAGIGTGTALLPVRSAADRNRSAAAKWVGFSLFWTTAVALLVAAVFVPGPAKIVDVRLLYAGLPVWAACAVGVRFKRAAGIPLLSAAAVVSVVVAVGISPYHCVPPEKAAIARFRLLSDDDDGLQLIEILDGPGAGELFELSGRGIRIAADLLHTADYYFFGGDPFLVGSVRFLPAEENGVREDSKDEAGLDVTRVRRMQKRAERLVVRLPGISVSAAVSAPYVPVPLFVHSARVDANGNVTIEVETFDAD